MNRVKAQKTVSLVLGSGGARGMAHIGIIRCLEDRNYSITNIAGASIGALVGGFYAAGKLDQYERWVCALQRTDVLRLLDLSFNGGGLFKGYKIMDVLKRQVGDAQIQNRPIEFPALLSISNASGKSGSTMAHCLRPYGHPLRFLQCSNPTPTGA